MSFPFHTVRLDAEGFYDLINTWAEMQLLVTPDSVAIIGDGYRHEIAEAFSALVFDWEARIPLSKEELKLPEGSYDLNREDAVVYAYKDGQAYPLADRPVTVEVTSVPEA